MKLKNDRLLPVGVESVWSALNDDGVLLRCIPGCESLTRSDPHRLEAVVALAIGPVKARFNGRVHFEDVVPMKGYRMVFEGQGGIAGFSKGTALVQLVAQDDGSTMLSYDAAAQVGGKIAQVGSRLVDAAAQKITTEFFTRFEKELGAATATS